jgi:hypothetical protein
MIPSQIAGGLTHVGKDVEIPGMDGVTHGLLAQKKRREWASIPPANQSGRTLFRLGFLSGKGLGLAPAFLWDPFSSPLIGVQSFLPILARKLVNIPATPLEDQSRRGKKPLY